MMYCSQYICNHVCIEHNRNVLLICMFADTHTQPDLSLIDHGRETCETVLVKCWNPSNGLHLNSIENVPG